jgi:hypothetical protein
MATEPAPARAVRGYYSALGVQLPGWASENVSCRCFANPGAHSHEDRNPSCSVSLQSGAFKCHACGAEGGAFDAATALGRSDRAAMDLLIEHGLEERRSRGVSATRTRTPRSRPAPASLRPPARRPLQAGEHDLRDWREALARQPWPLPALRAQHRDLWTRAALTELGCGWDGQRIIFPIRSADGALQGVLRYASRHDRTSKALAIPGTVLGPIPHPAAIDSPLLIAIEGLPDLVAARAQRLPAFAIPGTQSWRSSWVASFAGRTVITLMDCDAEGRSAAARIRRDLTAAGIAVHSLDLDPDRDDGYDLSDRLSGHPEERGQALRDRILARTHARAASPAA